MLSSGPSSTRPRPPAKMRRSITSSPSDNEDYPPPYAENGILSGGGLYKAQPIFEDVTPSTNAQVAYTESEPFPSPADLRPAVNDVLHGRTRDELEEMLLTAHNIIRKHEKDLTKSSSETQFLRQQNLRMKSQFERLSLRLPRSPNSNELEGTSRSSSSLSLREAAITPPVSPRNRIIQTPMHAHRKRPSMASPIVLAQLSDQNAELISKLDQLQVETEQLDAAGKQKLRKLEREIDLLKDELERIQVRNAELEAQRQAVEKMKRDDETLERRKAEREQKTRAIRKSLRRDADDPSDMPMLDFAPSSSASSISSLRSPGRPRRSSLAPKPHFELDLSTILSAAEDSPLDFSSVPSTIRSMVPPAEMEIVVQLLSKIEELENANRELAKQQAETEAKILSATKEVNVMKQAYQDAEEDVREAELSGEFPSDEGDEWEEDPIGEDATFRMTPSIMNSVRSFKSSDVVSSTMKGLPEASPTKSLRSRSSKGSLRVSSLRGSGNMKMFGKKARKPLTTGLFVSPPTSPSMPGSPSRPRHGRRRRYSLAEQERFAAADFSSSSPPKRGARDLAFFASVRSTRSQMAGVRPVPSFGDMGKYLRDLGFPSREDTETLALQLDEAGAGPSDWTPDLDGFGRQILEPPQEECADDDASNVDNAPGPLSRARTVSLPAKTAVEALLAALDPSIRGRFLEQHEHILPVGCLRDSPPDTFFALDQAVSARPSRWIAIKSEGAREPPQITYTAGLEDDDETPRQAPMSQMTGMRPKLGDPEVDPWETTFYGSDFGEESEQRTPSQSGHPTPSSTSKRDAALMRMRETMVSRRRRYSNTSTDDERTDSSVVRTKERGSREAEEVSWASRYDPKALAARLRGASIETFFEIVLIIQCMVVIGVFIYACVQRGPRALLQKEGSLAAVGSRKTR